MSMEQISGQPMRIEGPSQTPDFGAPGNPYESVNPANNPAEKDLAQAPGYYHEDLPKPVDPTAETQTAPNGPNEPPKPPTNDFENTSLALDGLSNVQETSIGLDKNMTPQMPVASETNVQGSAEYAVPQPQAEVTVPVDLNAQDSHEYKV